MVIKDGIEITAYGKDDFEAIRRVKMYFIETGESQCKIVVVDDSQPVTSLTGVIHLMEQVESIHTLFDVTLEVTSKTELEYILGEFEKSDMLPDTPDGMLNLIDGIKRVYRQEYLSVSGELERDFDITRCMQPPVVQDYVE